MSKRKSLKLFKSPVLLSLILAFIATAGLFYLANRKKTVLDFPKAETSLAINQVKNSSFEIDEDNDKYPDNWTRVLNIMKQDSLTTAEHFQGERSVRISSGKEKYYSQEILGNWPLGTFFSYGYRAKAVGMVDLNHHGEFVMTFTSQDGTVVTSTSNPPNGNYDWIDRVNYFMPKTKTPIVKVEVKFGTTEFKKGDMYFDYVNLYPHYPVTTIPTRTATPTGNIIISRVPTRPPATPSTNLCAKGDANADGVVNMKDYYIMMANWSMYVSDGCRNGDFNSDGLVNTIDLNIWSANTVQTPSPAPLPTSVQN